MHTPTTTEIILPGGCSFRVWAPSHRSCPYFPTGPDIHHGYHCQCVDEQGVMDDDTVFMALWLRKWAEWRTERVLASTEYRNQNTTWTSAYNAACLPWLSWAEAEWDLPSMGRRFVASRRTEEPIDWFWKALDGARDLSHRLQPDHARRFVITMESPADSSWGYVDLVHSVTMEHGRPVAASTPGPSNSSRSRENYAFF
ncbi:hypothetical protein G7054_g13786 [Neopestalotiopsis clavispora]|nr:hypothetical protein G7054_g13786 [Neopestalotiopsis clavispora]